MFSYVAVMKESSAHMTRDRDGFRKQITLAERPDVSMRRQVVTDMKLPNSVWKKKVSDTLSELNIIQENFSGKVVICFKDGGISYIEKT